MRVELTDRDTDLGALGRQLPLGGPDVGPAADQVLRHAHGDLGRHGRYRLRVPEELAHVVRRPAEQDRQRVLELLQRQLERRHGRLGVVEQGLGLVDVKGS